VKGQDSLYFTMLNGNKRSITIDSKHPKGQGNHRTAGEDLRRAGGKFRHPVRSTGMGFTWNAFTSFNPRMIMASVKASGPVHTRTARSMKNIAQCAGGSASTTGFRERPATGDRRADRR